MLREKIKRPISGMTRWYTKFERPISGVSLIGGFIFDAITLTRVDQFWENFWVAAHLLIVALCIVLVNRGENEGFEEDPEKIHFWLIATLQFFFGGLLSTFLVFYFRSGTIAASWPFFLILGGAFVANERLRKHYTRLTFQISLFFLSILSFSIFLIPVLVHQIGAMIFLASGIASLMLLLLFLKMLKHFAREKFSRSRHMLFISISGIFIAINAMYFLNLIPPIPLSLKNAGIYHSITRNADGNYVVQYEDEGWLGFFKLYDDFHITPGETAYAYSAVFSPASLNTTIVHVWSHYDENSRSWLTVSRYTLSLVGGREGGYRTYSRSNALMPGHLRVSVETPNGSVIGILRFNVILDGTMPALTTKIEQ